MKVISSDIEIQVPLG